jgi:segregation and condensation protein A
LIRRLLEYDQMQAAAQAIDQQPRKDRDFSVVDVMIEQSLVARVPTVLVADLAEAWRVILNRARATQRHHISREELSVRSHMSRILRHLHGLEFVRFDELFRLEEGVAVVVVSFLAVLELARESLIDITQSAAFEPIYVKLRKAEPSTLELST